MLASPAPHRPIRAYPAWATEPKPPMRQRHLFRLLLPRTPGASRPVPVASPRFFFASSTSSPQGLSSRCSVNMHVCRCLGPVRTISAFVTPYRPSYRNPPPEVAVLCGPGSFGPRTTRTGRPFSQLARSARLTAESQLHARRGKKHGQYKLASGQMDRWAGGQQSNVRHCTVKANGQTTTGELRGGVGRPPPHGSLTSDRSSALPSGFGRGCARPPRRTPLSRTS